MEKKNLAYPFPLIQTPVFDDQSVYPGALVKITAYKRLECTCCPDSQPEVKYSFGPTDLADLAYGLRTFAFVRDVMTNKLLLWVVDAGGQTHAVSVELEDVLDEYITISRVMA